MPATVRRSSTAAGDEREIVDAVERLDGDDGGEPVMKKDEQCDWWWGHTFVLLLKKSESDPGASRHCSPAQA
ncbi:MAG TPA: hypothetical protein VGO75_11645 [Gemmatimonadaceae bacterium]|nr:hypothetical protein [Gemmatimonadaceae bacterium]